MPFEIQFFMKTMNQIYEVNSQLPVANEKEIEFMMESGIWFIEEANYSGTQFVEFVNEKKIKQNAHNHKLLWQKIRQCLSDYYYNLKEEKYNFYEKINELCFRVMICSCWNKVIFNDKIICKKVKSITTLDVFSLEEFLSMVELYTDLHLRQIE